MDFQDVKPTVSYDAPPEPPGWADLEPYHDEIAAPAAPATSGSPAGDEPEFTEEDFWTSRAELTTIRTFAQSRLAAPWATLGECLVRVVAATPASYQLPAIVGGRGSLNLYIGIVGSSGSGKGAAAAVSDELLPATTGIKRSGLGSGEGFVSSYVRRPKATAKDPAPALEQHTDAVLFSAPEIDGLKALNGRQGSTLMGIVRDAWNGGRLDFGGYSDPEKARFVAAHAYRACLSVGIQPGRADALLNADEKAGGTPQRFVWLPATDPTMPAQRPEEPDHLVWRRAVPSLTPVVLRVCETAVDAIVNDRRLVVQGLKTGDDNHALLARLKVAAALGLLSRNASAPQVTEEDWMLAGFIMARSADTRQEVEATMAETARDSSRARGRAQGLQDSVATAVAEDEHVRRTERLLDEKLKAAQRPVVRSDLRGSLRSGMRRYFDEAISNLADQSAVRITRNGAKTTYETR